MMTQFGWDYTIAVVTAFLLGSVHCAGMCGPFAILSLGVGCHSTPQSNVTHRWRVIAYHLGRLMTYLSFGVIAGTFVASLGVASVFQNVRIAVGVLLVLVGFWQLARFVACEYRVKRGQPSFVLPHVKLIQRWTQILAKIRKSFPQEPRWISSFALGLTSTLLPCGWLYVYVVAAAAAPTWVSSVGMMFCFWLGTIPALLGLQWGWVSSSTWLNRWRSKNLIRGSISVGSLISPMIVVGLGSYLTIARASETDHCADSLPHVPVKHERPVIKEENCRGL